MNVKNMGTKICQYGLGIIGELVMFYGVFLHGMTISNAIIFLGIVIVLIAGIWVADTEDKRR